MRKLFVLRTFINREPIYWVDVNNDLKLTTITKDIEYAYKFPDEEKIIMGNEPFDWEVVSI
jgi:hypothetical protein